MGCITKGGAAAIRERKTVANAYPHQRTDSSIHEILGHNIFVFLLCTDPVYGTAKLIQKPDEERGHVETLSIVCTQRNFFVLASNGAKLTSMSMNPTCITAGAKGRRWAG